MSLLPLPNEFAGELEVFVRTVANRTLVVYLNAAFIVYLWVFVVKVALCIPSIGFKKFYYVEL